jgi:hypothetical protein
MYVTRSPGDVVNRAYIGLNISRDMMTYHSRSRPPASWPSSPVDMSTVIRHKYNPCALFDSYENNTSEKYNNLA